jgi:hypothetical protein
MREEEGCASRAPRLHRERRDEATKASCYVVRTSEGEDVSTKPKTWDGKPATKGKKTPKQVAQPVEPIPDEAEVEDEQTTLGEEQ